MKTKATKNDHYKPLKVERYTVGPHTLTRVANLIRIRRGRMDSLEASIRPEDYPRPTHNRTRLVVACGMGVDSIAMLIILYRAGIRPDVIHWADTGSERAHTYRYVNLLNAWLKSIGFPPLVVVRRRCPKAGHRSLFEANWKLETLPSAAFHKNHSCSIEWKLKPQRRFDEALGWLWTDNDEPVEVAIGFDAEEISGRRGVVEMVGLDAEEKDNRRSVRYKADDGDERYKAVYPLAEKGLSRTDCLNLIKSEGLPLPGKSACFMCPIAKLCELRAMKNDEPENLEAALDLEKRFENGKHYREGGHRGLRKNTTWAEWLETDEPSEGIGLSSDLLPDAPVAVDPRTIDDNPQMELFNTGA